MVEAALYILTGISLYAGTHHLYLGSSRTAVHPHTAHGLMYLLLAGFAFACAFTYQPNMISALLPAGKLSISIGILLWGTLIWFVAFYTRCRPLLLLDALTAAWLIFLIKNMLAPNSLLYSDVAQVNQTLPSGATVAMMYSSVSSWWTALELTMLASLLFSLYAGLRMFRSGNRQAALALTTGLFLLMLVALSDHLVNTRVIQAVYLAPFGFLGFLLANSMPPVWLAYLRRRKARQPAVIYNLTYSPEQASFHADVSQLRAPQRATVATADTPRDVYEKPATAGRGEESVRGEEEPMMSVPAPMALTTCDQTALNTISDNLIDIAVYATMAINRLKRGDADPKALEMLCRKVRAQAIKTRRMAGKLCDHEQDRHDAAPLDD